ncbi:MAG: hypothetical protein EBT15_12615 [Betaproteobacteria bacterium]|nr:hypothetical protein [Betaproteobacteria bacterium]
MQHLVDQRDVSTQVADQEPGGLHAQLRRSATGEQKSELECDRNWRNVDIPLTGAFKFMLPEVHWTRVKP